MQYAIIPMQNLKITNGRFEAGSHATRNAYDLAGINTGIENFTAPFDSRVAYVTSSSSVLIINTVRVKTKLGIFEPNTLMVYTFHDNDVSDLSVNQYLTQGQVYYQEGDYGNATGNHVHMQIATGNYDGSYPLIEISPDVWDLKGTKLNIEDVFYITDETNVIDDNGYTFSLIPDEDPNDEEELINATFKNYRFVLFRRRSNGL